MNQNRIKARFLAFVAAMTKEDYPAAIIHCQKTWVFVANNQETYLSQCCPGLDWARVDYRGASQVGKCSYDIKFKCGFHTWKCRLICETKEYTPHISLGRWGVNPYSIKRVK